MEPSFGVLPGQDLGQWLFVLCEKGRVNQNQPLLCCCTSSVRSVGEYVDLAVSQPPGALERVRPLRDTHTHTHTADDDEDDADCWTSAGPLALDKKWRKFMTLPHYTGSVSDHGVNKIAFNNAFCSAS